MLDISGFGTTVVISASNTFPIGVFLTQFSDDADAADFPSVQIADKAMGVNGDLIVWSKANPLPFSLSLVPQGVDDINMSILFNANRVGKGKIGARDIITLTMAYPSGNIITLSQGVITDGMPGTGLSSQGRLKTKTYNFAFQSVVGF